MATNLDANQVLQGAYDESSEALKTSITAIDLSGDTLPVVPGLDKVDSPTFTDGTSINASSGSWLQLKAATTAEIKQLQVYDTTGRAMSIAVGGSGSEIVKVMLGPGVDGPISVIIPSGSRISIRSAETTAPVSGFVVINYLG